MLPQNSSITFINMLLLTMSTFGKEKIVIKSKGPNEIFLFSIIKQSYFLHLAERLLFEDHVIVALASIRERSREEKEEERRRGGGGEIDA